MDNSAQERLKSVASSREKVAEKAHPREIGEVKQRTSEVLRPKGGNEADEAQEGAEALDGRVSESTSENKDQAAAAGAKKSYTSDEVEAIRAKLLAALPPQEVMVREIRRTLIKQEKVLSKRMKKLKRNSHRKAFELTNVVSQLRQIREYFSQLAHATYELIKHLWLKIVHGV